MLMLTDIQIAQGAKMLPIVEIAEKIGIKPEELYMYGPHKAKLTNELFERVKNNPKNKESNKKAALNRAAWYKNPENRKKFEEQIKARDRRNREKKQKLQGNKS